jgi:SAM-dependent methyltransferase
MATRLASANLLEEASAARILLEAQPDVIKAHRDLVSTTILAQTLFALWDSGFYEHLRAKGAVRPDDAAALGYQGLVFDVVLKYLVGRGILETKGDALVLTAHGESLHNVFTRGLIRLYVGGYGPLLGNLGPALRGEVSLDDPAVKRLARAVAGGTEDINCVHTVPAVIQMLRQSRARFVLDLGCGTGGFLVQIAKLEPSLSGIGIDVEPEAIDGARENARQQCVDGRLEFRCAAVGTKPIDVPAELLEQVDTISCMFLLHEFGRHGEQAIVDIVASLVRQFPGRRLIVLESDPARPPGPGQKPAAHFGQLDYWFVHPLSLQGPPMPPEMWEQVFVNAGARLLGHRATFPSSIARIYDVHL